MDRTMKLFDDIQNADDHEAKRRVIRRMRYYATRRLAQPTRAGRAFQCALIAFGAVALVYAPMALLDMVHPAALPFALVFPPIAFLFATYGWMTAPFKSESEYFAALLAEYEPVDTAAYNALIDRARHEQGVSPRAFVAWMQTEFAALTDPVTAAADTPHLASLIAKKR